MAEERLTGNSPNLEARNKEVELNLHETLKPLSAKVNGISFSPFKDETQMPDITSMIGKDLSEPYSIYTYRYFILGWPNLCLLAFDEQGNGEMVGVIICKIDQRDEKRGGHLRGYIGMLTVKDNCRRRGIGSMLAQRVIRKMIEAGCAEAVLETEVSNKGAIYLYENLGFIRDKRIEKYYLNGGDAFRLKLDLRPYLKPDASTVSAVPSNTDDVEGGLD
mmetsp:Transcript_1577/g.1898  ORF Transcript_1577/g.1898 Transcript_1577/m.1898 type:complete len:219 (-) Transcript_1577:1497-2153(-)